MSSDLSYIDRLMQRYERSGTSLFIRTYLKDTMELVNEFEFTGVVPGAPIPIEVQAVARNILSDIARLGPTVSPVGSSVDASGATSLVFGSTTYPLVLVKSAITTIAPVEVPTGATGAFQGLVQAVDYDPYGLSDYLTGRVNIPTDASILTVTGKILLPASAVGTTRSVIVYGSVNNSTWAIPLYQFDGIPHAAVPTVLDVGCTIPSINSYLSIKIKVKQDSGGPLTPEAPSSIIFDFQCA